MLICNDRWNPDLVRILALDGARYLLIPTFGIRDARNDRAMLSRARENGVPVVQANVGATIIVDNNEIVAVDRKKEAITFGTITIPPPIEPSMEERDELEREFLAWREREMRKRYRKKSLPRIQRGARKTPAKWSGVAR